MRRKGKKKFTTRPSKLDYILKKISFQLNLVNQFPINRSTWHIDLLSFKK